MDIWTMLTIASIPPTVAYYAVKLYRHYQAKRREEIVRRVQTGIPLERAVYRLRENARGAPLEILPAEDTAELTRFLDQMNRETIYRPTAEPYEPLPCRHPKANTQSGSGSSY